MLNLSTIPLKILFITTVQCVCNYRLVPATERMEAEMQVSGVGFLFPLCASWRGHWGGPSRYGVDFYTLSYLIGQTMRNVCVLLTFVSAHIQNFPVML